MRKNENIYIRKNKIDTKKRETEKRLRETMRREKDLEKKEDLEHSWASLLLKVTSVKR